MKKALLIFAVFVLLGGTSLSALDLTLGLSYGDDMEEFGITAGLVIPVSGKLRVAPDLIYWLIDVDGLTALEFNVNLQYCFVKNGPLAIYGLAGLQLAYVDSDFGGSDSELGLNIGAGLEYNLGGFKLFVEPRFTINGFEQFTFTFGGRISL